MVTDGGNGSNDLLLYTHSEEKEGGIGSAQDGGRGGLSPGSAYGGEGQLSSCLTHSGEAGPSGEHGTRKGQRAGPRNGLARLWERRVRTR